MDFELARKLQKKLVLNAQDLHARPIRPRGNVACVPE